MKTKYVVLPYIFSTTDGSWITRHTGYKVVKIFNIFGINILWTVKKFRTYENSAIQYAGTMNKLIGAE